MEPRKSNRCAAIETRKQLQIKEKEEADKQLDADPGPMLSAVLSNQPQSLLKNLLSGEKRKRGRPSKVKELLASPAIPSDQPQSSTGLLPNLLLGEKRKRGRPLKVKEPLASSAILSNQPQSSKSLLKLMPNEKGKQGKQLKSEEPVASPAPQLSEYEKQIQQNIEERKKVFAMMVSGPKKEFLEALQASASRKKSVKRQRDSTE